MRPAPAAVLAATLVAALVRLPQTDRSVSAAVRGGRAQQQVGGVPLLVAYPDATTLVAAVRKRVPKDAEIRIVVRGASCVAWPVRSGGGLLFWLQYQLLPRTATCDTGAEWQVWALTRLLPPDAEVIAPGYAIVHQS